VRLRVAGFTIEVASRGGGLDVAPGSNYDAFVASDRDAAPPDVLIDVAWLDGHGDGAGDCLFDSGGPWRLYRHDEGVLFRFFSSNLASSPYKVAHFNHDFSRGLISLHRRFFAGRTVVDPLEYPLDELLVISLLGRERGVEIHGCGVIDTNGTGHLFVGQSGAGKSTMARLWLEGGAEILSDDRIVVRRETDGLWMYGTPWHGEAPLASPRRAALSDVFFLRHDAFDEVVPVKSVDAVTRLFTASFPPFHDARALQFSLSFLESIADNARCSELRFRPTPAVVELVQRRTR